MFVYLRTHQYEHSSMITFEAGRNPNAETFKHLFVEKCWIKLDVLAFTEFEKLHNFCAWLEPKKRVKHMNKKYEYFIL